MFLFSVTLKLSKLPVIKMCYWYFAHLSNITLDKPLTKHVGINYIPLKSFLLVMYFNLQHADYNQDYPFGSLSFTFNFLFFRRLLLLNRHKNSRTQHFFLQTQTNVKSLKPYKREIIWCCNNYLVSRHRFQWQK